MTLNQRYTQNYLNIFLKIHTLDPSSIDSDPSWYVLRNSLPGNPDVYTSSKELLAKSLSISVKVNILLQIREVA